MHTGRTRKKRIFQPFASKVSGFVAICCWIISCLGCQPRDRVTARGRPNVVLLLVDSLRPDSLHDYGNARKTDPVLAEFGKKGVRFTNAHSHSSTTKLSVASLFTGLIPPANGVREALLPTKKRMYAGDILSSELTTIAEVLKKNGYSTAAFVNNPHLRASSGFSQGFKDYKYFPGSKATAAELNQSVLDWLKKTPRKPFFVYVHYMDLHISYNPTEKYRLLYTKDKNEPPISTMGFWRGPLANRRIKQTRALYEAQINYWDDSLRLFIGQLEKGGWLSSTLFIILADHGEEFYDHGGFGHNFTLYEEMLRVPLYFIYQGVLPSGQTRNDLVQLVDIFPTIGHFTERNLAQLNLNGLNLFPAVPYKNPSLRVHYAEVSSIVAPRSVQTEKAKLIYNSKQDRYEFYDLIRDPREQKNVYKQNIEASALLKRKLIQIQLLYKSGPKTRLRELDPKTIEQLKSLGYISGKDR